MDSPLPRQHPNASRQSPTPDVATAHPGLTGTQRRHLRGLAHSLKPVVMLGNKGVTPAVLAELAQALNDHELIKVRLAGGDRALRSEQLAALLEASGSDLVMQVGHIAALFRRNPEHPRIALPR